MKKILLIIAGILGVAAIVFFGIRYFVKNNSGKQTLSSIPFKKYEKDRWGLLSLNGNVIIENEWENEPSLPVAGFVRVKNKDGKIEFFTVEKKTKKVGEEYKEATGHYDGLAAVVKENSHISYIDKDFKEVFVLKEIEGKGVETSGIFREGLAKVKTSDGKWGFINKKGEVIIKPKYDYVANFNEGLAYVSINEYDRDSIKKINKGGFINQKGEEVIKFKDKISYVSYFSDGVVAYSDDESFEEWGCMDKSGQKIIKPTKDISSGFFFIDGYASFTDNSKNGIINKDGEKVIRAKYEVAFYSKGLVLIKDQDKFGFINIDGEEIIKPEYEESLPFLGNNTIVKDGSSYIVIDKKGKQVGKDEYEKVYSLSSILGEIIFPDETVESDFFDATAIANKLCKAISVSEINGLTESSTILDVIRIYGLSEASDNLSDDGRQMRIDSTDVTGGKYDEYSFLPNSEYKTDYTFTKSLDDCNVKINFDFDSPLKKAIVERVYDSYWEYSYDKTIGYEINSNAKIKAISCEVTSLNGKAKGKEKILYENLKAKFDKAGLKGKRYNDIEEKEKSIVIFIYKDIKDVTTAAIAYAENEGVYFAYSFDNEGVRMDD